MSEREQLEARLAAARERKAELDAKREEREELERLRREVEAAEAAELEMEVDRQIEAAEAQGKRLGRTLARVDVRYPDGALLGAVLVQTPHPAHWSKFENKIGDAKGTDNDHLRDELWRRCLVWPDVAKVESYVEAQPFTRQRLTDAIAVLAGVRRDEIAGK